MGIPETQAYCDDVQCIGGLCEFHRKSAVGIDRPGRNGKLGYGCPGGKVWSDAGLNVT